MAPGWLKTHPRAPAAKPSYLPQIASLAGPSVVTSGNA
jgi:hypothetical protein